MDDLVEVTATAVLRDEGTLVLFSGLTENNEEVRFAVERRYARDIAWAIEQGDEPVCAVPSYMIL